MKYLLSPILFLLLLGTSAGSAFAQTSSGQFNPNVTSGTGNSTFGGVSFSGVGAAVLGCTNVGSAIAGGIGSLADTFGLGSSGSGSSGSGISDTASAVSGSGNASSAQRVPTTDRSATDEARKANKRESCLDAVAYAVSKSLLQQVTNKTLNWVNTGLGGNPLYVRDIDSYLKSVTDERISLFIDKIPNQDPIFGNTIRSIMTKSLSGVSDGLADEVMDTPEAQAHQSFQEDFKNGGWDAFLDPDNNALSAVFRAGDEVARDTSNKEENVREEVQANGGFLNLRTCAEYAPGKYDDYTYQYQTYYCRSNVTETRQQKFNACLAWSSATECQSEVDAAMPAILQAECINGAQHASAESAQKQCVRYSTTTPGSIIANQVAAVTTSSIRQLENADEINEVLGAFFDELLNRLLNAGLGSVGGRGNGTFTFSGPGANVVYGTNGSIINIQSSSSAFGISAVGNGAGYGGDFDVSRPQDIRLVLQTQYNYLNRMRDARVALNRIVPTLGALDYCIPGPNPDWQNGLQDNINSFLGGFYGVYDNGQSTLETVISSIPIIGGLFGGGGPDLEKYLVDNAPLYDRVTQAQYTSTLLPVSFATWAAGGGIFGGGGDVATVIQNDISSTITGYQEQFSTANLLSAFNSVDPNNGQFVQGFLATSLAETKKLPSYTQSAYEIDATYETLEQETQDAIASLEAIRAEANQIVANAKTRYIAEQAAAGTPVNMSCINQAYVIDTSPIVPVARQESDAPSQFFDQFIEANNYFYAHI